MPPHLKILSDLRKAKRKKNDTRRAVPTVTAAAKGSPTVKGGKQPPTPRTTRVDKLAAMIASPPPRNTAGRRPQAQPAKTAKSQPTSLPRKRGV
jgi:hypothetical protein